MSNHKLDEQKLIGAYDQILEEGFMTRLGSFKDNAVGAIKGGVQQAKGAIQKQAGGLVVKGATALTKGLMGDKAAAAAPADGSFAARGAAMAKRGNTNAIRGARAGDEAKYKSFITRAVNDISNDLKKLGMPVGDDNQLRKDIQAAITKNLTQVGDRGQFRTKDNQDGFSVINKEL